jgi:hypothetical protein
MSTFKCYECSYTNQTKQNVKAHFVSKHSNKILVVNDIIKIQSDIKCNACNKSYDTVQSLKRHVKTCQMTFIKNNIDMIKKLEERILLMEQNQTSTKPTTINNNNNNIKNTNSNNTINNITINLTSWKDPEYPDNMDSYYKEAIKKVFMSVPNLIQNIHFNPDMPNNMNICIKNFRTKVAKVYDGTRWTTIDEDKLLNTLINTYEGELENWADEKPARMKYIEEYKEIKKRDGKIKVEKDLKDTVKKIIYDNSGIINTKNYK